MVTQMFADLKEKTEQEQEEEERASILQGQEGGAAAEAGEADAMSPSQGRV